MNLVKCVGSKRSVRVSSGWLKASEGLESDVKVSGRGVVRRVRDRDAAKVGSACRRPIGEDSVAVVGIISPRPLQARHHGEGDRHLSRPRRGRSPGPANRCQST